MPRGIPLICPYSFVRPRERKEWQSVSKKDGGKVFGGAAVSHGLGVGLRRTEYNIEEQQRIRRNLQVNT